MRISELTEVKKTRADNLPQSQVDDWLNRVRLDEYSELIDYVDSYELRSKPGTGMFLLTDGEEPIAYLNTQEYKGMNEVYSLGVSKKHKRRGLAIGMYIALAHNEYTIMSDSVWTKGAEMIWKKLLNEPTVNVYAYDKQEEQKYELTKGLPRGFFQDKHLRLVLTA